MSTSHEDSEHWEEVERLLSHHCKGTDTPMQTLNRLVHEGWCCPAAPILERTNCTITQVRLSANELARLRRKDDEAAQPGFPDEPIVLYRDNEDTFVVDGRRRVNKRIKECTQELTDAFLIECNTIET